MMTPPTGILTFLFTDIEGSTKLWEQMPELMQESLAQHDQIMQTTIATCGGVVFKTVGDAFYAVFTDPSAAIKAAISIQQMLATTPWGETGPLRVRIALHTGSAQQRDQDYFGPSLDRVARVLASGHGGQILLTQPTYQLVSHQLPDSLAIRNLGEHRLKDLTWPEHLYQLVSPELKAEFPPLRTLNLYQPHLPMYSTPLVGREAEVTRICSMLCRSDVTVLTLTGPGGVGKTRLSVQVAVELLECFDQQVYFIPLDAITDPALVAPTILQALGLKEEGQQSPVARIAAHIRDRRFLLVLDNFEQVIGAATIISELTSLAPNLRVLISSRILLRITGEHEISVMPLPLPTVPDHPWPPALLDSLAENAAVQVFCLRAQAIKADFKLTPENAAAVRDICVKLDGLPLALELAAARFKMLPPQQLLKRLDQRLKLLTSGPHDLTARQQTLRHTLDWSYDLLAVDEQRLFARLSVFSGGCRLEAAEEVCNHEQDLTLDVWEGIARLIDQSLLYQDLDPDGTPRVWMLETIREYATEKLNQWGDQATTRGQHADYFRDMAQVNWKTTDQSTWIVRLKTEHPNFRAALQWSIEQHEEERANQLAGGLAWFWCLDGHLTEGRRWLEQVLIFQTNVSAPARAWALRGAGVLMVAQSDYVQAGLCFEAGLALLKGSSESHHYATLLGDLAVVAYYQGDLTRTQALFEESLVIHREMGNTVAIGRTLYNLGDVAFTQGDTARAMLLLKESLALARPHDDKRRVGLTLHLLADIAIHEKRYDQAITLLEESLALITEVGDSRFIPLILTSLGHVRLSQEFYQQAREIFQESLVRQQKLGDKWGIARSLEGIARTQALTKRSIPALYLLGATEIIRQDIGTPFTLIEEATHNQTLATIRSHVDPETIEAALAHGRTLTMSQAIQLALAYPEPTPLQGASVSS